jgi:hypothetical protein
VSSKHSYVTFGGDGFDTLGTGANENRVDYTSLPTATTSALPAALEGAFFKVLYAYSVQNIVMCISD